MSLYLLINRIQVQNANAIAGFTWGFPAITHFLGFTHNLKRKLSNSDFNDLSLQGCGVIAHQHHVHTYGDFGERFLQSKNPANLRKDVDKVTTGGAPSIVEEGKMNMTVSLLIDVEGFVGRRTDELVAWFKVNILRQRLAGGTILSIAEVALLDTDEQQDFFKLKRKLLPGFVLMDRSQALARHYEICKQNNGDAELLAAWLDFSVFKQQARPKSDLIDKHFKELVKVDEDPCGLNEAWVKHLQTAYQGDIPDSLQYYFSQLATSKINQPLLQQWMAYVNPDKNTSADWTYLPKPEIGYLVPIMTGYKAISPVYDNHEIANTRDHETPVCFVESTHSVGEWQGVNHFKNAEDIAKSLWHYHYEEGWYLCQQNKQQFTDNSSDLDTQVQAIFENPEDELN